MTIAMDTTRVVAVPYFEQEPNDTALTAQFLDPGFEGDCVIVEGDLGCY